MANSIIAGNDFRLIIRAKKSTGAYLADMDLADVEDLRIYLTRAGRSKVLQSYTLDGEGHAVIYVNAGAVTNATYGIEMVGVYGGARLRAHNTSVFTISGHGGGNSGVLNDYYADIVFVINVAATDVYVQNAIEAHNEDEASHPHLLQLIEEAGDVDDVQIDGESIVDENKIAKIDSSQFGKVDDVKVNGTSVVSNKEANITMPEKVSDLPNDADYATKQEAQQMVDDAKIDTVSVDYQEDGGAPDASASFEDGELAFSLKNMKMKFSDLTEADKAEIKGDKGDPGDSAVYDPSSPDTPDFVMANTIGQSTTKAMTQKAVTDELETRTNEVEDELKVGYLKTYNLSLYQTKQCHPNPSTGTWINKIGSDNVYGIMVEVVPGDSLRISVPNSNRGVYCFLKNNTATIGGNVNYATGSAYESLEANQTVNVIVPSDAHYLYLFVGKGSTAYQYTVAINEKIAAKEFLGEEIDFSSQTRYSKYISSANVWVAGNSEYNRCVLIPISKGDVYYIKPSNVGCIIAFLSEDSNVGSPIKFANGLASRIQLSAPTLLTIPNNATLLYVFDNTNGSPMLPLCVNISKSPFGQAVKAGQGMYGTPIYYTVTQGYYAYNGNDRHLEVNSDMAARVKIGTSATIGAFRIILNDGYHLRAVYSFDVDKLNAKQIVYDSEGLTDYTFIPSTDAPIAAVTICKDDATQSISPSEDIVKFFGAQEVGLLEQVTDSKIIKKAVFLGDSITHGVYSYYDQDIHDDNHRYNGFDITDLSDVAMATRFHGIPYYFGLFADCECINIAKRGSGWVQDGRNIGNAYEVASAYDFSDVDFCALCFGINDYINGISIGDIDTMEADTLIGNMSLVLSKIFSDNPLCKVVVYSPYNSWGQVSHGGDYVSNVLYGNESTDYALGFDNGGGTLQDYIDAIDSVCQYYGVQHVALSNSNIVNRLTLKNIMIDGLHPSKESFRALAAEIYGKGNYGD